MSNPNDPAYPLHYTIEVKGGAYTHCSAFGLTKREAFAMAAMQGLLANGWEGADSVGHMAVMHADALLRQLAGESE